MRIVVMSTFYSKGMGYTENCLPKALATLGHSVHVLTSNLNIYGNTSDYDRTYEAFLGPADQGSNQFTVDGYKVHRLRSSIVAGYVLVRGIASKLRDLQLNIAPSTEIASL